MKFKPDSTFHQVTTTLIHFIFLNIVYLLLCLPVITIGWATSALYEVCLNYADGERGELIPDYFQALKSNWKPATVVFFVLLLPLVILIFSISFWFSLKTLFAGIVGIVALILGSYFLIVLIYSLALVGQYDTTIKQTLKNAMLLPLVEPLRSMMLLLILVITSVLWLFVPFFRILFLMFGIAFVIYCSCFLLLKIFTRYQA